MLMPSLIVAKCIVNIKAESVDTASGVFNSSKVYCKSFFNFVDFIHYFGLIVAKCIVNLLKFSTSCIPNCV